MRVIGLRRKDAEKKADIQKQSIYYDKLIDNMNASTSQARSILNLLLAITIYIAVILFAASHEALLFDRVMLLPNINIGLTLSTSFVVAPLLYIFVYTMLVLKFRNIAHLAVEYKAISNNSKSNNLLQSFFYLDYYINPTDLNKWMCAFAVHLIPFALLFLTLIRFLPYQSDIITPFHFIILVFFTIQSCILAKFAPKLKSSLVFIYSILICIMAGFTFIMRFNVHYYCTTETDQSWEICLVNGYNKADKTQTAINIDYNYGVRSAIKNPFNTLSIDYGLNLQGQRLVKKDVPSTILSYAFQKDDRSRDAIRKNLQDAKNNPEATHFNKICDYETKNTDNNDNGNEWTLKRLEDYTTAPENQYCARTYHDLLKITNAKPLDLSYRNLRYINLQNAELPRANLRFAQLQGADLRLAQLQGADLWLAQLQRANLGFAKLQGADLGGAQLQRANLGGTQLQRANLWGAQLQRANLWGVQLQGADLMHAHLQGANLWDAQLQGANLRDAKLQGANFSDAKLQGANLRDAKLQGAYLFAGQFQDTQISGTIFDGAYYNSKDVKTKFMTYTVFNKGNMTPKQLESMIDICGTQKNISDFEKATKSRAMRWGFFDDKNQKIYECID